MTITKNKPKWEEMGLSNPLPDYLLPYVYEVVSGKPVFYKGYKEAILHTKQPQEMGCSTLQGRLLMSIVMMMGKLNIDDKYVVVGSEMGLYLSKNSHRCTDIAIFNKEDYVETKHYAKIPPKIVIEVDIDADLGNYEQDKMLYYQEKTTDLIEFGVEKVIWIFTESKNIVVATNKTPWEIYKAEDSVNIIDDCNFCLKDLLS